MNVKQLGICFRALHNTAKGPRKKKEAVFQCSICDRKFITSVFRGLALESCGCKRDRSNGDRKRVHGFSYSKSYRTWKNMIQRCQDVKHKSYNQYGGRGITVCSEWHSLEKFIEDMGERPERKTLDRINNDLGYFKENCKWSSNEEQGRNRRSNKLITINGVTKCTKDWSEHDGVTAQYHTICKRLENGWDPEKAVFTKPRTIRRNK